MAERISWSLKAKSERREILEYRNVRNGNKNYSLKLAKELGQVIRFIGKYNYLDRKTDYENVRVTFCRHYLIFYEIKEDSVEILTIWDNRRNPPKLDFK